MSKWNLGHILCWGCCGDTMFCHWVLWLWALRLQVPSVWLWRHLSVPVVHFQSQTVSVNFNVTSPACGSSHILAFKFTNLLERKNRSPQTLSGLHTNWAGFSGGMKKNNYFLTVMLFHDRFDGPMFVRTPAFSGNLNTTFQDFCFLESFY